MTLLPRSNGEVGQHRYGTGRRRAYGADHLDLLVNGYVAKLLGNAKVVRFLAQHYAEILVVPKARLQPIGFRS